MEEAKTFSTVLRRKIKIYVDITLKDDMTYGMGQRLVSFFGQASVFENTESIIEDIEDFFEMLSLNFLTFGEENKFENDVINNLENYENLEESILEKNSLFLPVIIYFYYTDKRTDFFILSSFKKRHHINVHKWVMMINYLKLKEKKFSFFNNMIYFEKSKKYINIFNFLKKFKNTKFVNLLNLTSATFLKTEELFLQPWSELYFSMYRSKDKLFFFKNYKYKLIKSSINLLKKLTSLPIQLLLNMVTTKISFLDEDFEYNSLFENAVRYIAQLHINKKTIFRRLRRRKRFKKKILRNASGNKITYYKIYAYYNQGKKKRKK